MPKIATLNSVYPTDCATLLTLRAECSGYSYFLNSGYINYYINDNFKPYEHRLVAEMIYGEIPAGYHVHHINGIRSDNRAANLELLSPNAHSQHHGAQRFASVHKTCAYSDSPVVVSESRLTRHSKYYCNRTCMRLDFHKVKHPSATELQRSLLDLGNWRAVGKLYGVSDNAVRKWAKDYGIDTKAFDGRLRRK